MSILRLGMGLLAGSSLLVVGSTKNHETPAFMLEGAFEDVFAGKHHNAGSFTVKVDGPKALIHVFFENGYREIAGTDGRDSFIYHPFSGDKTSITNWNGLGDVSFGHFPTNAQFFHQMLWLICVQDTELRSNLPKLRFHFHGDYTLKEIVPLIKTSGTMPDLVTNIQWYAPPQIASGTTRYDLAMYPKGWLLAELAITSTQLAGKWILPRQIIFNHYHTRAITNIQQISEFHPRNPTDVFPVETAVFSITNAQSGQALASYVPEILDPNIRVHDHRSGHIVQMGQGKTWIERDIFAQHHWTFQMGDGEYGLIGRDAQTLPGGVQVKPYTQLCFGMHKWQIPSPIFRIIGFGFFLLLCGVTLTFVVTLKKKRPSNVC